MVNLDGQAECGEEGTRYDQFLATTNNSTEKIGDRPRISLLALVSAIGEGLLCGKVAANSDLLYIFLFVISTP